MSKSKIFRIYGSSINDDNCRLCENFLKEDQIDRPKTFKIGPFSCWHLGAGKIKIVFVGKNTWIDQEDEIKYPKEGSFRDITEKDFFSDKSYFYFNYIHSIIEETSNIDEVCVTNLAKCKVMDDDKSYVDLTKNKYYENCISKVFSKEITELKPDFVVFLTNIWFNEYLDKLDFGSLKKENINKENKIKIYRGKESRTYPWQIRKYNYPDRVMYTLLTRHPQGAWGELKEEIVSWLKNPNKEA